MKYAPYPRYKPSGVAWLGDVPEHWRVERLKHAAEYCVSPVDKVTAENESPIRLCNYTDVYYNERIRPDMAFMEATASPTEIQRFRLRTGDVLITKDSEDWQDIAIPALVEASAPDLVCGYHLAIIRPDPQRLAPRFLLRALQSSAVNRQFQLASSGVTRFGLPKEAIGAARIPLPPMSEQQAIADFLDAQTASLVLLIEKQRRLIEKLQEKRAALISRTVTRGLPPQAARAAGLDPYPKLKPSGVEWIGEIPERWEAGNIRRFALMRSGHTPSRQHPEYWEDCTIPWFGLVDVWQLRDGRQKYLGETAENISELGLANSAAELLPAGTVVLSRTASVGFSGIMPLPMATTQDFINWVCGPRLLPEFLLVALRAMKPEFDRLVMGSTHQTIYMPDAASFVIPTPPIAEQRAIVAFLDAEIATIDRAVDKAEAAIGKLQEYRAALISAAVTGKIDVRSAVPEAVTMTGARTG